jgi:hypothetical protein
LKPQKTSETMGKKKGTATTSAAASTTGSKAIAAAPKKTALKAATAATKDAQCDWTSSTITKRDKKKMWSLGLISDDEEDVRLPGSNSRPNLPAGFTVMFSTFLYRGLSLPSHEFLWCLLFSYGIQLWLLTPNSILHLAILPLFAKLFLVLILIGACGRRVFSSSATVAAADLTSPEGSASLFGRKSIILTFR